MKGSRITIGEETMTDQKKFDQLKLKADNAYCKINGATFWILSLKDRAAFPDSWESISDECENLLDEIMALVDTEKTELKKKEQNQRTIKNG